MMAGNAKLRQIAQRLEKAKSTLLGAEHELTAGRYDNAASRAYYAAFQSAIAMLEAVGRNSGRGRRWGHSQVWSEFARMIDEDDLDRRLAAVLPQLKGCQVVADYSTSSVNKRDAARAVREAAGICSLADKIAGMK